MRESLHGLDVQSASVRWAQMKAQDHPGGSPARLGRRGGLRRCGGLFEGDAGESERVFGIASHRIAPISRKAEGSAAYIVPDSGQPGESLSDKHLSY